MLRWLRRFVAAALVPLILAPLALALPVQAADLRVTLDTLPGGASVGVPLKVGFSVLLEPDGQPATGLSPLIVARNRTGSQVVVQARPASAQGHYAATLILPSAGSWNWEIYPSGSLDTTPVAFSPLEVSDPADAGLAPQLALLTAAILGTLGMAMLLVWRLVVPGGQTFSTDVHR